MTHLPLFLQKGDKHPPLPSLPAKPNQTVANDQSFAPPTCIDQTRPCVSWWCQSRAVHPDRSAASRERRKHWRHKTCSRLAASRSSLDPSSNHLRNSWRQTANQTRAVGSALPVGMTTRENLITTVWVSLVCRSVFIYIPMKLMNTNETPAIRGILKKNRTPDRRLGFLSQVVVISQVVWISS